MRGAKEEQRRGKKGGGEREREWGEERLNRGEKGKTWVEKEEVKGERRDRGEEEGWRDYLVNERRSCCDTP